MDKPAQRCEENENKRLNQDNAPVSNDIEIEVKGMPSGSSALVYWRLGLWHRYFFLLDGNELVRFKDICHDDRHIPGPELVRLDLKQNCKLVLLHGDQVSIYLNNVKEKDTRGLGARCHKVQLKFENAELAKKWHSAIYSIIVRRPIQDGCLNG